MGPGVSFQFYCGAIIFAWLGNACYAIFRPGNPLHDLAPLPVALSLILFSFVHCARRYGLAGAGAYFGIVVSVAWTVESLGVMTGMPFGVYRYSASMEPFIGVVPLSVLFAYFAMSYPAWIVANAIVGRLDNGFDRRETGLVSAVAAGLMVFWDFSMDPLRSTLEGRWIWQDPGLYLGVPASNFLGWFITSWLMFRAFGGWLLHNKRRLPVRDEFGLWPFWAVGCLIYLSFCGEYLLNPLLGTIDHVTPAGWSAEAIFNGAALAASMTMLPAAVFGFARCVRILGPQARRSPEHGMKNRPLGEPVAWAGDPAE